MSGPREGHIFFTRKAEIVNHSTSMEYGLRPGVKYFGILLGMWDKRKTKEPPTAVVAVDSLSALGFCKFDWVKEFYGEKKINEFVSFCEQKIRDQIAEEEKEI